MADGIDAELQVQADFTGPLRESDKLVQNILKMIQQMRGFEKVVLDSQKAMSQLGQVSGKEIRDALTSLRIAQEGSVQSVANRTAVRTVGNALSGTDAARDRDIELKKLEDRRKFVQLGAVEFQQSQKQKAVGEAINITAKQRNAYEQNLISLGKLVGKNDEDSLRRKSQVIAELSNEIVKENEILRLKKEQDRVEKAKLKQANTDPLERFNRNGGADIFRIQTRLLLNYKLIASAYSSTAFIGNFIVQLDKAFFNLQAITQSTERDMANLKISLLDAAAATKFTAVEVTNAAVILGQAGFSSKQIQDSIKSVTLLASATGTGLEQAVATASTALNVFQMQASEMANVANLMTASVNESKLSIEQLSLGLQYAGSVAASAGVPLTELLASFGVLADQGIKSGSTLGTGFRQLVKDLEAPSNKLLTKISELGLKFSDIDIKSQGFTGALNNLTKAGFTAADAFQVFETRAVPVFLALTRGSDSIELARQKLILSNAAVEANESQMKSLSNTWSNFQSVSSSLVNEGLTPFLRTIQGALEWVNKFLIENKKLAAAIGVLIGAFAGLAAASGALFVGGLVGRLLGVSNGIKGIAAALGILKITTDAATGSAIAFNIATGGWLLIAGAIAGGLAAAVGSMGLFSDSMETSTDKMDELQSQVDASKGRLESYGTIINETTKFLNDYGAKQDKLTPGSLALKTAILEAQDAFGRMGNSAFGAAESIEELLGKVRELRNTQIGEAIREATTYINGLNAQAKEYDNRTSKEAITGGLSKIRAENTPLAISLTSQLLGDGRQTGNDRPDNNTLDTYAKIVEVFKSEFATRDEIFAAQNILEDYISQNANLNERSVKLTEDLRGFLNDRGAEVNAGQKVKINRTEAELESAARSRQQEKQPELDAAFVELNRFVTAQREFAKDGLLPREGRESALNLANAEIKNFLENTVTKILGDDGAGQKAFQLYLPDIQKSLQDASDGIEALTSDQRKYDENRDKITLETLELQKKSIEIAVAKTQRPAGESDIEKLRNLQAQELTIKVQQKIDEQSTKSFGKSLDAESIKKLNEEELNNYREQIRIEQQNEIESLRNKNQQHIEELRAVDIRDTDARMSLIEESTRRYQNRLQEIENLSVNVDSKISANTGRIESFDQPQNRNAISQSDRYFAEQEAKQLDIEKKGTALLQLNDKISAADAARREALELEIAAMGRLEAARAAAFAATDNKSRSLAEEAARAAATEAKAARDKAQEHVQTQQELNRELVTTQAYYEKLTASTPSTVNLEKTLQFWRETSGAVESTAVAIENGFLSAMEAAQSGLATFLEDVVTGAETAKDAFGDFARGVIKSMLQIAAQRAATGLLDLVVGAAVSGLAGSASGGKIVYKGEVGPQTQRFAAGGAVVGGMPNRDSVPALLMPGEYVLNKNAVRNIGMDTLHQLNSGAKRSQAVASSLSSQAANDQGGSRMVNVYVVNKEGMPPVGPSDVIAVVGDNIARGGALRTLIKQVVIA